MASKQPRKIPKVDNIIVCESKEESIGFNGSEFLQASC